jgi:colicin import membrane protein
VTTSGSARPGLDCSVQVTQIPSGDVVDVRVLSCNGDEAVVRSIEAAVLRASPLPQPPTAALFERTLILEFRPVEF